MKPLMLRFKGINSFVNEQSINFNKVTHDGIFAIFGPTGSGKSSIIDCITIALYDEPSRYKAKGKEFVNINCNEAHIIFEFEYDGIYRIEKTYKRTKDKVEIKSAKLINITDKDNIVVLADKISDLTAKIQNILGLKYDNFVRSVVLPQDQFSKFLFLEGKERNDMLSEILGYNKLNDKIKRKLSLKKQIIKDELNTLQGEMKLYEHINDELLKEKTKSLAETKNNLAKNDEMLTECEQEFKKIEEIKSYAHEKQKKSKDLEALLNMENDIKVYKNKIEKYERIKDISEEISKYTEIKNTLAQFELDIKDLQEKINEGEKKKNLSKGKYDNALNNKALHYEQKINEKAKYIALLDSRKKLIDITKSTSKLREEYKITLQQSNAKNEDILKLEENTKNTENSLKLHIGNKEKSFVAGDIKKLFEEAFHLHERLLENIEGLATLKIKVAKEKEYKESIEKEIINHNEEITEYNETLLKLDNNLLDFAKEPTREQYRLLQSENAENALIFNAALEYNKISQRLIRLMAEKEDIAVKIELLENEIISLTADLDNEKRNMHLQELRGILTEGEECPLCGSTVHDKKDIDACYDDANYAFLCNKLSEKSVELKAVQKTYQDINVEIKFSEDKKESLFHIFNGKEVKEPFSENYFADLLAKVENAEESIKELTAKKEKAKEMIVNTDKVLISVQEKLKHVGKTIVSFEDDAIKLENIVNGQREGLTKLTDTLSIGSFENIKEYGAELSKKEALYNNSISEIERLNKEKEKITANLLEARLLYSELNNTLKDVENRGKDLKKEQEEIQNKINDVTNGGDLDSLISETEQFIKKLIDDEEICKNDYEKESLNLTSLIKSYEIKKTQIEEKQNTFIYIQDKLNKVMTHYSGSSIEEINSWLIEPSIYEKMSKEVTDYDSKTSTLKSEIRFLNEKILSSGIPESECMTLYEDSKQKTDSLKATQKTLYGLTSSLKNEIETMSSLLTRQKELIKEKDKIIKRGDLISELDELLKANKFFSYITSRQMQGIAVDASMRIKKITGGKYGIEVHENSFVIKDYFSEGTIRRVVTLSGGETFIFSFCLALALCTKISTRNKSSMDFFFLDEGFGSLDNDTLETVYSTLLSLKSQKITIGVISHVESLYERIDAKIIVKPSNDILIGSSININSFYDYSQA